jgi:hypothetical protein
MAKAIRNVFKIDTLSLVECNDGYYLYDTILGMNISMRAKTEQDAYIEALMYYQKRLQEVIKDYKDLDNKVQNFLSQFDRDDD